MKKNLLSILKSNTIKFSKAQRQVGDYILKNPLEASFTTLEILSTEIGTSTTTIMRFCNKVGYSGYSDLQKDLQALVKERIAPHNRLKANMRTVKSETLFDQCAQKFVENVTSTQNLISEDICVEIIDAILSANKIYMLGARTSHTVSYFLYHGLTQLLGNCQLVDPVSALDQFASIQAGDLIIVISLPRYASSTVSLIKTVKAQVPNVKVISITDSYQSPVAIYSDIVIPCQYASLSFHNSMSSALFIADYIVTAVAMVKQTESTERLTKLEGFFKELNFHID